MRIRLKAPAGMSTTGIYGANGTETPTGTELVVEREPLGWAGRYDIIDAEEKADKVAVLNPAEGQPINKASDSTDGENPFPGAETAPQSQMDTGTAASPATPAAPAYAVETKGGGYYVITKDGAPVSKSLKKADIEGFDDLSAEDKAAFADLHKA